MVDGMGLEPTTSALRRGLTAKGAIARFLRDCFKWLRNKGL